MSRGQERASTLGYLDARQANQVKERAREQEADLVLRKSCKELSRMLDKHVLRVEVAKVHSREKADVVMPRFGLENVFKRQFKGMDYGR